MITPDRWLRSDPSFPPRLAEIKSAPQALYTLGARATLERPCVAVVGTRHPTPYGERVATELTTALARAGACIVSGMATGIDGIAHRTTLTLGGHTVAVLGAGIDYPYPRSHAALHKAIATRGLVVSEFEPGKPPFKGCFPRRNRIIAGLCSVVIVVEAGAKSGALITADYAVESGRTVAAVPGPIDSQQSVGTNQLIRDGANVIASVPDALMLIGLTASATTSVTRPRPELDGDQALVWDAIAPGRDADAIIAQTGLSASRCAVAITMLEMRGLVKQSLSGEFQKRD